ncbi:hypothetical protein FOA52_000631 [Chlamydomonas sp. UWO 241]|nr:hypothetical protein FOA52_000631 [Chlamydomonas sp. UWO 241]
MPYFGKYLDGPVHALFTTDALETQNREGDEGMEQMTSPYININTGVYFVRYWEGGKAFFEEWFKLKDKGHDQDGLNTLVRGHAHRGEVGLPNAIQPKDRMMPCALSNTTFVSFLPVRYWGVS